MSQQETRQERRARERKERKHSPRESETPTEPEVAKGGKGAYLLSALVGVIIALILVKVARTPKLEHCLS